MKLNWQRGVYCFLGLSSSFFLLLNPFGGLPFTPQSLYCKMLLGNNIQLLHAHLMMNIGFEREIVNFLLEPTSRLQKNSKKDKIR